MSGLISIIAGLMRTLLIRLPLGIWLAVLFSLGWLLLERNYAPHFPVFPCTTSWPPEFANPIYPDNPSQLTLLDPVVKQVSALDLGVSEAELSFGRVEYGAMLGTLFGLALCLPCGIWVTMRRYAGVLAFPFRVIALAISYAALGGALGYALAHLFGANLISTGYAAVFGLLMPIVVPLPFWLLRPLFPSVARRQAKILFKQARRESRTTLADIAKLDPALGNVTKGKQQKEWDYYATVSGLFLGLLLGEKRGAPAYQRAKVEKLLRRKLNKQYEKGEPGLTAVSQFCKEYLEKGTKFTTEVLVGLWLAMQMKGGDLNPVRDKELATSLGGHIVQGMNRTWPSQSRSEAVFASIILWAGVAGLMFLSLNPRQVEGQIAWLDDQIHQRQEVINEPVEITIGDEAVEQTPTPQPAKEIEDTNTSEPATTEQAIALANQAISPADKSIDSEPSSATTTADDSPEAQPPLSSAEKALATETKSSPLPADSTADPTTADLTSIADSNPDAETPTAKITPAVRAWTHKSGKKIQASAVSYRDGAVELLREDGRSAFIALKDLSFGDRQAVYSQFAGENAPDTSPAELNPGELRIHRWTAANSSKQVTAAIVKLSPESVELLRADGQLFSIPIDQLSTSDQDYLRSLQGDQQ